MSDNNALLQQAYTLIENDEREKAQEILAPLVQEDADNVHLWWVYAHAVRDAPIGQAALERVLELDPQYPGARELKADVLEAQSQDPDLIAFEASESLTAGGATTFEVDDWEDLEPVVNSEAGGSSARGRIVMLVVILLVVAGGALVYSGELDITEFLSGILPTPAPQVIVVSEPTAESILVTPDSEPTEAPEAAALEIKAEATSYEMEDSDFEETASATGQDIAAVETRQATAQATIVATPSPTINPASNGIASFVSSVAEAIADFPILPWKSGTLPTQLGNTLVLQVCAVPGPQFNDRLNAVMTAAVSVAEDLPDAVDAFAVGLLHCDDPEALLRIIGVSRDALKEFANEESKAKDFQRAWQPLS